MNRTEAQGSISYYDTSVMEILRSAFRHGTPAEDIHHALRTSLVVEEIGEDPTRFLVLGADRAGRLLELVVLDRPQGPAVIHAMAMRAKYQGLLPKGGRR